MFQRSLPFCFLFIFVQVLDAASKQPNIVLLFSDDAGYADFDFLTDETCSFIERNKDRPFFAFVSFNAVHTPMEPDPKYEDMFPELKGKRRKLAQMTYSLDLACGKIMAKLKDLELDENTLVIVTNDNGGPTDANRSNNYPLSGTKANHLEGGIRVPGFAIWPGHIPSNESYPYPVSTLDFLPTFLKVAGGDLNTIEVQDDT